MALTKKDEGSAKEPTPEGLAPFEHKQEILIIFRNELENAPGVFCI